MNVVAYPADLGGCGFYRVAEPARALIAQGADVDLVQPDEPDDRQLGALYADDPDGRTRVVHMDLPDADVVVIQRPLAAKTVAAIEHLQERGVQVVVEIDDDFEAIDRRNVSWPKVQPHLSADFNRMHLMRACLLADHVVVTTPALAARYAPHGRVTVVPNFVPARYCDIEPEPHDGVYVGWSGSTTTHPNDLQQCGGLLARTIEAAGAQFAVIGTGDGVQRALNLADPVVACGWQPLDEYPTAMAQVDVGIVPLDLTPFNEAKSWLKGLEFASVGVPFIASPTGPYRQLQADHGLGVLAAKPKHWKREMSTMLMAPGRADLGAAMRETVRERLTIERNAERWLEAWTAPLRTMVAA